MKKTIIVSAFDAPFFEYALRMYASVRFFHPEIELYALDLGLTEDQMNTLNFLHITVLQHPRSDLLKARRLRLCFGDFLLHSFLQGVKYDIVIWIDADTMLLKRIDPLILDLTHYEEVVGHPGRNISGPIYTMGQRYSVAPTTTHREFIDAHLAPFDDKAPYIATGLWGTTNKGFLAVLDGLIDHMHDLTDDSPVFSAAMHRFCKTYQQLDPALWNFSRELLKNAQLRLDYDRPRHSRVWYQPENTNSWIYPFTAGFSLTDSGARGHGNAIDQFYDVVICGKALISNE